MAAMVTMAMCNVDMPSIPQYFYPYSQLTAVLAKYVLRFRMTPLIQWGIASEGQEEQRRELQVSALQRSHLTNEFCCTNSVTK